MSKKASPGITPSNTNTSAKGNTPLILLASFIVLVASILFWSGRTAQDDGVGFGHLFFANEMPGHMPTDQVNVPNHDKQALDRLSVVGQVPRIQWDTNRPFALWAVEQDRPVILTNSSVHLWPAIKKWSPEYLANNVLRHPLEFKTANDPVFIYSQHKPINRIEGFDFVAPYNYSKMTLETFWNRVSGKEPYPNEYEKYLYYTGCITRSSDNVRVYTIQIILSKYEPASYFSIEKGHHDMNLWLGSPGVTAQTHLDEVPNWAAQIYGHKRWILSPPSEAWKIYPFPHMHSFRSQSQIDMRTGGPINNRARASGRMPDLPDNQDLFPDFHDVVAYEALLSPGEIMYIPPFWYHRVVTEDTSIAVNTWSHLPGGHPHGQMDETTLPFELDWDEPRRIVALRIFALRLGAAVAASAGLSSGEVDPVFNLLHKQYDALFNGIFGRKGAKSFGRDLTNDCFNHNLAAFEQNLEEKIENGQYIEQLMHSLMMLKNPDARRLLMAGFLESVVTTFLGVPEMVYPFIRDCLPNTV